MLRGTLVITFFLFVSAAAPGAGGTAAPEAGAAPAPEADLATAGPDPGPTPGPALALRAARHAEASPNPPPGLARGPNQSLAPGVAVLDQTGALSQGPDPGAEPNLQRAMEMRKSHKLKSR